MIAVEVGRALLAHYNNVQQTSCSAQAFFVQVIWPLFFDRPDKTMYWICNSPFTQLESVAKQQHCAEARTEALKRLQTDLTNGRLIASTAVGFAADRAIDKKGRVLTWATTSSQQLLDRHTPFSAEDGYLSWIGGPTGIGVAGGFSLLSMDGTLLYWLYEGWAVYRHFLSLYPELVGRQLESWNGQWLIHRLSPRYQPNNPTAGLKPLDATGRSMKRASWSQLAYALAHTEPYRASEQLPLFVCRLGQTNETIGYVPMELGQIRRYYAAMASAYPVFSIGSNASGSQEDSYKRYGLESPLAVAAACTTGSLGLMALRPKPLDSYLGGIDTLPCFPAIPRPTPDFPWACAHIWLREALNDAFAVGLAKELAEVLHTHLGRAVWSNRLIDELSGKRPRLPHGLQDWLAQLTDQLASLIDEPCQPVWAVFRREQPTWSALFRWYFLTLFRFEFALCQS